MAFILGAQRDTSEECRRAFEEYRNYLKCAREKFPPSAYALATSDWYFDFTNHDCPHDARLQSITISELPNDWSSPKTVSIQIKLALAYDDRVAEITYPIVSRYSLEAAPDQPQGGHSDWRYDEFRLTENGRVIHEIEWRHAAETGRWSIEASDVHYVTRPA